MDKQIRAMRRSVLRLRPASLQAYCGLVAALAGVVCAAPRAVQAYTVVTVSTAAPAGLEASFIAATTTQFNAVVFTNPFVPNTYQVLLHGLVAGNPAVLTDSGTYAFVWSEGQEYERNVNIGKMFNYENNCSSPTFFGAVAIDSGTCLSVLGTLVNEIYTENLSTPTIVPGQ